MTRWRCATVVVLALMMMLLAALPAAAYQWHLEGPRGPVGIRRPPIALQFELGAGESFQRVDMWLNGQQVPARGDAETGRVSYRPRTPLAPGTHRVRVDIEVTHPRAAEGHSYRPLRQEFTFTVSADAIATLPGPAPESRRALAYLNRYRRAAGLEPMTVNPAIAAAAAGHARYVAHHGSAGHGQQPDKPLYFGTTPAERMAWFGYYRGSGEVIAFHGQAETAIDNWLATVYHRVPLVRPGNVEMGYGEATAGEQAGQEQRVQVLNVGPGAGRDQVVLWPFPGQTDVPVGWNGLEVPDPLARHPEVQPPLGYSLSATFGQTPRQLTLDAASLSDPGGRTVPLLLFSPANDPHLQDTVGAIPHDPLQPGTTYTVRFAGTVDHGDGPQPYEYRWSFTTADHEPVPVAALPGGFRKVLMV